MSDEILISERNGVTGDISSQILKSVREFEAKEEKKIEKDERPDTRFRGGGDPECMFMTGAVCKKAIKCGNSA